MDIKNEVFYWVYFFLFGIVVLVVLILIYCIVDLAVLNGDKWCKVGEDNYMDYWMIEVDWGNIFVEDGSFLVMFILYFNICFDLLVVMDEAFEENLDILVYCLVYYVLEDVMVGGVREYLLELCGGIDCYVLLKK